MNRIVQCSNLIWIVAKRLQKAYCAEPIPGHTVCAGMPALETVAFGLFFTPIHDCPGTNLTCRVLMQTVIITGLCNWKEKDITCYIFLS